MANINFGKISNEALEALNAYSIARIEGRARIAAASKAVNEAADTLEAAKTAYNLRLARGEAEQAAFREAGILEAEQALQKAKESKKGISKDVRDGKKAARALVPDGLEAAYNARNAEGISGEWMVEIADFLRNIGIEDTTEGLVWKTARIFDARMGVRKCGGTNFTKEFNGASFKDMFLHVLLEYLVNEKGVLDMDARGSLSLHVWEEA